MPYHINETYKQCGFKQVQHEPDKIMVWVKDEGKVEK
jgi:hypothetical protein